MSQAKAAPGGVKLTRAKQVIFMPPGILGYNNLEKPDASYDKFSADSHYNEAGVAALIEKVDSECIAPLFDKWLDDHYPLNDDRTREANTKARAKAKRPDAAEFVNEHLKEPKNGKPFPENFMRFSVKASGARKDKTTYTRTMAAWTRDNKLLDLATLKLGRGSIIQVGVVPGIFANPMVKDPQPTFQLVGVRILKLVQFGASRVEAVNEDDIASVLGEDFEMEDLSEFASAPKREAAAPDAPPADDSTDPSKLF